MIIGHQKQRQFLKRSIELKHIAHAYLFCGPEKLGKKTIALEFAELINGKISPSHPDLILIEPEPEKKEISIDQIRELIWKLSLKPYSSSFKIAIIDNADFLTTDAQHSLLKILEEPKGSTLLILISRSLENLFPTICSRCEILKFYPVKKSEIEKYVHSEEIAEISLGRPGLAIDFSSNPEKLKEYKQKIKELIEISRSDLAFRFQYTKELSQNSNIREILFIWLKYFRNILLEKCLTQGAKHSKYSFSKLKKILQQIQNTNFLISTTNVNTRLALEILMLEL